MKTIIEINIYKRQKKNRTERKEIKGERVMETQK